MTDELTSIEQIQALVAGGETDWSRYGDVAASERDDVLLLSYTAQAMLAGRWNWFERVARGLVFERSTGRLLARPFDKFFNYGEGGRLPYGNPLRAWEKIDGSLGILYRHGDQWRITTRGSLYSEQGEWATRWFAKHCDASAVPADTTLLFEIIYPDNRIVVDYGGYEGLYLIGGRNFASPDLHYHLGDWELVAIARELGEQVRMPQVRTGATVDEILSLLPELTANQEGFVCEFLNGQRFKFKGAAYLAAHRVLNGLTFKRVLEAHEAGVIEQMRAVVPEELWETAAGWIEEIEATIDNVVDTIEGLYETAIGQIDITLEPREHRKQFALWVNEYAAEYAPYLFARATGRGYRSLIYKRAFLDRPADPE